MQELSHIFKAYDIRGKVGSELNPELVAMVGRAFADWLPTDGPVAVGHDMRPDSKELSEALIQGLSLQGREVWDLGQVTSDMSYFAVGKYDLAGSAMITASHNPGADNGIKFYRDHVVAVGLDSGLSEIRDAALAQKFKEAAEKPGKTIQKNIVEDWLDHCLTFTTEIKPFTIAVDCGNGMAGAIMPELAKRIPLTITPLYWELDGTFPNHEANPQKVETLQDLIKTVKDNKLDFGVAFDGDGDRAGFVDDLGRVVSGSEFLAILAERYLQDEPGAEIIHEVRTSRATQELIREKGGVPIRIKAGRIDIGNTVREHNAPFGGETTGHMFFRANYCADSALVAVMVMIEEIGRRGKKLSELVDEARRYATMPEKNFEVADKAGTLQRIAETFKDGDQDWIDGITVNYPDYWFNIRVSNTESVIRLNAEAKTPEQLQDLVAKISKVIEG